MCVCVTNLLNDQLFSEENNLQANLQLRFKVLPAGAPSLEDQQEEQHMESKDETKLRAHSGERAVADL